MLLEQSLSCGPLLKLQLLCQRHERFLVPVAVGEHVIRQGSTVPAIPVFIVET
jgi:hypothetical protein